MDRHPTDFKGEGFTMGLKFEREGGEATAVTEVWAVADSKGFLKPPPLKKVKSGFSQAKRGSWQHWLVNA